MSKIVFAPRLRGVILVLCLATVIPACGPDPLPPPLEFQTVSFEGAIHEDRDLSAVAFLDPGLALASDEGDRVQFLEPGSEPNTYRVGREAVTLTEFGREVDIEGMAASGDWLYVLGSHSVKRPRLDAQDGRGKNRRRLMTVEQEPFRRRLYRIPLDPKGKRAPESVGLRPILERDPLLAPFLRIPANENGLNFEGLGADGATIFCGLRSPVLRGGYVPVVVFPFDRPADYALRFVQLGGRGIRGMARVEDGWLILAAWERGSGDQIEIFFWDGADQTPGPDGHEPRASRLVSWPGAEDGTAEAITVLGEDETGYDVLVLFDDVRGGAPRKARLPRPRVAP